ncbi:hypothetical protein SLA_0485 [Streptomyces laurentii]|uniref:Uncharacterized protein n=1 Tax=Streptomyces laurentii TaxID=39478 RepID=A0A160NV37_STRLU|nr:hypothetical protein SLA_0485 [Streptomyces laurentii]
MVGGDEVAAGDRDHRLFLDVVLREEPSQTQDAALQRGLGRGGLFLTPDGLAQPGGRDHLARPDQQGGQQGRRLGRWQDDHVASVGDAERTEQLEAH